VQDQKYRNAAKMFRSAFSSDFCPYEFGIIDTLTQALLPTTKEGAPTTKGVRAELYALNVSSLCSSSAISLVGKEKYRLANLSPTPPDLLSPVRPIQIAR